MADDDRRRPHRGLEHLPGGLPAILQGGRGGSIVFVGSTAAVKPLPTIGHYAAAKYGLVGLMKSLALELAGDSIRVNAVHPGGTGTTMTQNPAAEAWQRDTPGVSGTLSCPCPSTGWNRSTWRTRCDGCARTRRAT